MAKGRFYFYSLFLPLLPSPLPRKLRQQERHKTNHTKFVNVPCGWGMGEVSLRLRLRSRFINLPSIISANPATRPCHVPPGQTALSQCSLHKRNPPRPCTAGESADGCFNDRARAGRARGGPGVPIPNPKGLLRRQFLASIFVCSTPPPPPGTSIGGHGEFYTCPAGHVIDGLDVIRRQYLTKSIMDFIKNSDPV